MRIKRICYPVTVLGPGKRVGIWTVGCSFACKGCMTPELQNPNAGNTILISQIIDSINKIKNDFSGFTISGGEPFDQVDELADLVEEIYRKFNCDDIIIYTGYTIQQLKEKFPDQVKRITNVISVIIDGNYVDDKNDGVGLRGSSNQKIHIFKNHKKYEYMNTCTRELQVFNYDPNYSLVIGLL